MQKKTDPLALDPGSPENPSIFGQYLILGLVARGGMAEVYRAKKLGSDRLVALKCMRKRLSAEQKYVDMFLAEGKLASLFEHKNIVKTYEGGRYEGNCYFTMEYIQGKDLNHVLRKIQIIGSRMPIPVALYITIRSLRALDYSHLMEDEDGNALCLVNRDVSPSNIRVGFDGAIKMIDFGIAKSKARFTSEIGTLKGKFSYMSPEQIRGLPLDGRTDIFSMGIILYEMLTMERLFKAESETVLMDKVRKANINPPSSINSRINEKIDAIVLKALSRDRDKRYSKASVFADDLEEILESYKFDPVELSDLMKRLFAEDFQTEKGISRMARSLELNSSEAGSGKHESYETIVNQDFSLGKVMELEIDMDDDDDQILDDPVHTKDLLSINRQGSVVSSTEESTDIMKYIYILMGSTLVIIVLIIALLLIKK
jgi:eukaryotic-like serine/threonine-protein kinase